MKPYAACSGKISAMRASGDRAGRKVVDSAYGHQKEEKEESKEKSYGQEGCSQEKAGEKEDCAEKKTFAKEGGAEDEEGPGKERRYWECGV